LQHKKKLTFAWNISALGTDKDNWILTGIIDKSYFSKVELVYKIWQRFSKPPNQTKFLPPNA
jgi:hypothetical protein